MLCRPESPRSRDGRTHPAVRGLVLVLGLGALANSAQAQNLDGRFALFQAATDWVAVQTRQDPANILLNPLDERVRVAACRHSIQFDQPFTNSQTLRARCTQPQWQHFLSFQTLSAQRTGQPTLAQVAQTQSKEVWVANQLIRRGSLISPEMFERRTMDLSPSETALIQNPEDLRHVELLRDMQPGSPVRSHDLKPANLIKRGQVVLVSMGEGRGFVVTVRAESQQDGRLGELIRLKNPESGRLLSAMVTGPHTARGM